MGLVGLLDLPVPLASSLLRPAMQPCHKERLLAELLQGARCHDALVHVVLDMVDIWEPYQSQPDLGRQLQHSLEQGRSLI